MRYYLLQCHFFLRMTRPGITVIYLLQTFIITSSHLIQASDLMSYLSTLLFGYIPTLLFTLKLQFLDYSITIQHIMIDLIITMLGYVLYIYIWKYFFRDYDTWSLISTYAKNSIVQQSIIHNYDTLHCSMLRWMNYYLYMLIRTRS